MNDKIRATNTKRYGGLGFASTSILEKAKSTSLERYGVEWKSSTQEFRASVEKTCMDKYGVSNISKVTRDRVRTTCLERYGVEWVSQKNLQNTENLTKEYIEQNFLDARGNLKAQEMVDYFNYSGSAGSCSGIYSRLKVLGVKYRNCGSRGQNEIAEYIRSIYHGEVSEDNRVIIKPYEIDIYLPEFKIGIEYNGTYWHSDKHLLKHKGITAKQYEELKLNLCRDVGVKLYFIQEEQWCGDDREIVKSRILDILTRAGAVYRVKDGVVEKL